MAIHILTKETHPKSLCGIDLSTRQHSFMFGTMDKQVQNVCVDCKKIFEEAEEKSDNV